MKRRDTVRMSVFIALLPKQVLPLLSLLAVLAATTSHSKESPHPRNETGNVKLSDAEVENIVRRSYQYVAMYNVNNKFAFKQGGWNTVDADTKLKDHTMREIARPNNDTLYIGCMLDLRNGPVILEMPAFGSLFMTHLTRLALRDMSQAARVQHFLQVV